MAKLVEVCEALGYDDVWTHVNSGNVVFDATGRGRRSSGLTEALRRVRLRGHDVRAHRGRAATRPRRRPVPVAAGDTYFVTFLKAGAVGRDREARSRRPRTTSTPSSSTAATCTGGCTASRPTRPSQPATWGARHARQHQPQRQHARAPVGRDPYAVTGQRAVPNRGLLRRWALRDSNPRLPPCKGRRWFRGASPPSTWCVVSTSCCRTPERRRSVQRTQELGDQARPGMWQCRRKGQCRRGGLARALGVYETEPPRRAAPSCGV